MFSKMFTRIGGAYFLPLNLWLLSYKALGCFYKLSKGKLLYFYNTYPAPVARTSAESSGGGLPPGSTSLCVRGSSAKRPSRWEAPATRTCSLKAFLATKY